MALRLADRTLGVEHVALVTARNERKRGIYQLPDDEQLPGTSQGLDPPVPRRCDEVPPSVARGNHPRAHPAARGRAGAGALGREHGGAYPKAVLPELRRDAEWGGLMGSIFVDSERERPSDVTLQLTLSFTDVYTEQ